MIYASGSRTPTQGQRGKTLTIFIVAVVLVVAIVNADRLRIPNGANGHLDLSSLHRCRQGDVPGVAVARAKPGRNLVHWGRCAKIMDIGWGVDPALVSADRGVRRGRASDSLRQDVKIGLFQVVQQLGGA